MSLWFRRTQGLDTDTLRDIASTAGVSWDSQIIVYRGRGIGYKNGDSADVTAIQDAAENLLGYRPVEIDEPPKPTQETQE